MNEELEPQRSWHADGHATKWKRQDMNPGNVTAARQAYLALLNYSSSEHIFKHPTNRYETKIPKDLEC